MIIDNKNQNDRIIIKAKSQPVILPEENDDPNLLFLAICDAIREGGYNPVSQIVGYIMSGDPTYITSHKNARSLIMKAERDELVEELLKEYIRTNKW